jgi:acetyl esterase/lipase
VASEFQVRSYISSWLNPVPDLISDTFKALAAKAHVELTSIPGYWMDKPGLDTPAGVPPEPNERVIYWIHGGGFIFFSASPHDPLSDVPRSILAHCTSIRRAFATEYRLAVGRLENRTYPFPAALLDVLAGYAYLTHVVGFPPENFIIAGDSAGANLCLALTRYLVEHRGLPGLPAPPGAAVHLSPWVDLTLSDHVPGSSTHTNRRVDFVQPPDSMALAFSTRTYFGRLGDEAAFSRYVSPASVDPRMQHVSFVGFPRTLVVEGELEALHTQVRALMERMTRDMGAGRGEGQVEYYEAPDSVHDFVALSFHEPERMQALRYIAKWIA